MLMRDGYDCGCGFSRITSEIERCVCLPVRLLLKCATLFFVWFDVMYSCQIKK